MATGKQYYEERIMELNEELRLWTEKAAIKLITLSDELKAENIKIGQKLAEMRERLAKATETPAEAVEAPTEASGEAGITAQISPASTVKQLGKKK